MASETRHAHEFKGPLRTCDRVADRAVASHCARRCPGSTIAVIIRCSLIDAGDHYISTRRAQARHRLKPCPTTHGNTSISSTKYPQNGSTGIHPSRSRSAVFHSHSPSHLGFAGRRIRRGRERHRRVEGRWQHLRPRFPDRTQQAWAYSPHGRPPPARGRRRGGPRHLLQGRQTGRPVAGARSVRRLLTCPTRVLIAIQVALPASPPHPSKDNGNSNTENETPSSSCTVPASDSSPPMSSSTSSTRYQSSKTSGSSPAYTSAPPSPCISPTSVSATRLVCPLPLTHVSCRSRRKGVIGARSTGTRTRRTWHHRRRRRRHRLVVRYSSRPPPPSM